MYKGQKLFIQSSQVEVLGETTINLFNNKISSTVYYELEIDTTPRRCPNED